MPASDRSRVWSARIAALALMLALTAPLAAGPLSSQAPASAMPGASASVELQRLFAREWERTIREDPIAASLRGERVQNGRWPDRSLSALAASHRADLAALDELGRIERGALSPEERIDADLFQWIYRDRVQSFDFHEYLFPLNQLDGIQTSGDLTQQLRFQSVQDYRDWLERLRSFGTYMDQTLALLEQGVTERRVLPRLVIERIVPQIGANLVSDPSQSTFYEPFRKLPPTIAAGTADELRGAARAAIVADVLPAFRRMQRFFTQTYLPHARAALAVTSLPDGAAYYRYLVRHFTTTDLTPEQVHALGLERMRAIHEQMQQALAQAHFSGSLADFLKYLRSAPRFHTSDPQQLFDAYKIVAKTIDPLLVTQFGHLPRIPWGVEAIPADQAPNTYPAYSVEPAADGSRAAYMAVNLYRPETRMLYEVPVLTCHEGRPGHALQLSLATERTDLPAFRRFTYFDAYGEGWALYAETLCNEMGLYDDPYKRFGALSYQMWRAVRLVVDTGIHRYGMTRAQAVELLRQNTALSQQNIDTEVDRYIAWPGQALSYMIGLMKIEELRRRAAQQLGARFDVKAFHDVVLAGGTVPLSVLEHIVDGWIAASSGSGDAPPAAHGAPPRTGPAH